MSSSGRPGIGSTSTLTPRPTRQKRKLEYLKCNFCRKAKQKCVYTDQLASGERCARCRLKGLECSTPQRVRNLNTSIPNMPGLELSVEGIPTKAVLLLSIHTLLLMALEELKRLGEKMDYTFPNDPQRPARAKVLELVSEPYQKLASVMQEETGKITRECPDFVSLILEFNHLQKDINWSSSEAGLQRTRDMIDAYERLGHYGLAYVLQMTRFMHHPALIVSEKPKAMIFRKHFGSSMRELFLSRTFSTVVPYVMKHSEPFIPAVALKSDPELQSWEWESKDWLGRSSLHVGLDAGRRDLGTIPEMYYQYHRDILGRTALHLACLYHHDSYRHLLRMSSGLLLPTVTGMTELHTAERLQSWDFRRALVKRYGWSQVTPDTRDISGRFPSWYAAHRGDIRALKSTKFTDYIYEQDHDGRTALFEAVSQGHNDAARYMLDSLRHVSRTNQIHAAREDNNGKSPLVIAVERGLVRCVKLLIEHQYYRTTELDVINARLASIGTGHIEISEILESFDGPYEDDKRD